MNRCYACQACSIACKDWNELEPGAEKWMSVYEWESGTFPNLRLHPGLQLRPLREPRLRGGPARAAPSTRRTSTAPCWSTRTSATAAASATTPAPTARRKFATDEPGTKMSKCTMCVDRLAEGMQPACTASCPLRAFDFGPLDELVEKYGDVRYCEGMPSPDATNPAYLIWNPREKTPLLPYDVKEAIALNQQRGDLGTMFESEEDLYRPSTRAPSAATA